MKNFKQYLIEVQENNKNGNNTLLVLNTINATDDGSALDILSSQLKLSGKSVVDFETTKSYVKNSQNAEVKKFNFVYSGGPVRGYGVTTAAALGEVKKMDKYNAKQFLTETDGRTLFLHYLTA